MKHELRDPRPDLTSVTLVAVTSVALAATTEALLASMAQARFADVLLLSDQPPSAEGTGIRWHQIHPITSRENYSRFMLRDLAHHIRTPQALCIQWDGYVLDGAAWDPAFLDYDYIGAPWPHFRDGNNVGNGGFSLRSRRLLEACRELPLDAPPLEDVIICRHCRPQLEKQGIRFAPETVARRFAYERTPPSGDEFGFHGVFNLVRHLPPSHALRLLRELEPGMLARTERWELLGWALRHGRFRLALEMLRRLA
ncbi:MAG: hypothetical protein QOE50_531 [Sphingomonadales bacterium]|nr:hypothetical protein [Sphingomonadales bacterium]